MPVAESLVGRVYTADAPYTVSREKIREFAEAIKDPNPAYRDPAAAQQLGHPDVLAPPTFPIVLTSDLSTKVFFDPTAGIDFTRVVHGEQKFAHQRPLLAGDVIAATLTVDQVRVAAGNELVTLRTELRTTGGELVVTATMLIVVRGGAA